MTIDRAIEILDPEHRENYDGMDEVNEACRMGMEALELCRTLPPWMPFPWSDAGIARNGSLPAAKPPGNSATRWNGLEGARS